MQLKNCPNCLQMITSLTRTCPHCSYELFDEVTGQFKTERRMQIEANILRGGSRYNPETTRQYDEESEGPTQEDIRNQVDDYLSSGENPES